MIVGGLTSPLMCPSPCGSTSKENFYNAGDLGSIPGSGRPTLLVPSPPELWRARSTLSRRPLCGPLPYSSTQGSQVTPLRVRVLPGLAALGWNVPWGGALWLVPISTPSWQPVQGDKPRYSCSQVETTCFWPVWLPCQSSRHSSGRPLMARQNPLWN